MLYSSLNVDFINICPKSSVKKQNGQRVAMAVSTSFSGVYDLFAGDSQSNIISVTSKNLLIETEMVVELGYRLPFNKKKPL